MAGADPRARSFGTVAAQYERGRPTYPPAAVRWALGPDSVDVADIGAGTGKLTRALIAAGHRVTAIDHDPAMLAELARALPEVPTIVGAAEQVPLPDASVDAVVAGQSYHWFAPERALPEIARILRPGGLLVLAWNIRDEASSWVAALEELLDARANEGDEPDHRAVLAAHPAFGTVEERTFRWSQELDLPTLLDGVRSRSYVALLDDTAREALLTRVTALWRTHPDLGGATAEMPYGTDVIRARVR